MPEAYPHRHTFFQLAFPTRYRQEGNVFIRVYKRYFPAKHRVFLLQESEKSPQLLTQLGRVLLTALNISANGLASIGCHLPPSINRNTECSCVIMTSEPCQH